MGRKTNPRTSSSTKEDAFGDMKEKQPPPAPKAGPPKPPPPSGTQKVGGQKEKKPDAEPLDPELAMPLQKLEQVRNQDSPAKLQQTHAGAAAKTKAERQGLVITMRQSKIILALFLLLVLSGRTFAQAVRWDPPGGQLGYNQVSELALVFENCEPEVDKLRLPSVDGLTFGQPSQSTEMSMVNFKMTRRLSLVFPVRPTKRNPVRIPDFTVETDKGALPVKAASFTVGDATVGGTGVALDDISSAKLTVPKNTYWAGEVFPVTYTLNVVKRYFHSLASIVDWPADAAGGGGMDQARGDGSHAAWRAPLRHHAEHPCDGQAGR